MAAHAWRVGFVGWVMAWLTACGGGTTAAKTGPCAEDSLEGCNTACDEGSTCPTGLHCGADGTCTAECAASRVAQDCGAEHTCSVDGYCRAVEPSTPTGPRAGNGAGDDNVCADVSLAVHPRTPNVVLIVDQSGSMYDRFDGGTRWSVLKDALLDDAGIIAELQSVVRFGIALFTYNEEEDATCPVITPAQVSIGLDALEAIRAVYGPAEPGDNTPTGESIDAVLDQVQTLGLLAPDVTDPTIFVLATDGNPDTCELPDQGQFGSDNSLVATQRSVDAVKRAYSLGVKTYVIAVADEFELAQTHVNDLANAGVGATAAPGIENAPSYRVDDDEGLRNALRAIVTGEQSCDVDLDGSIVGDPSFGTVTLDDQPLAFDDDNGWTLVDDDTIRLAGDACEALKRGTPLSASFPCETVVVK